MSKGDDYAWQHPSIAALKAAGVTFVCRYESRDPAKNLTHAEADQLHAAGIATVTNWEATAGAPKLGRAQGVRDATEARDQHAADGGPPDRPIYFSADWDVQPGELATVGAYYAGVASVIGLARTGAYGGYRVIKWLLDNHLITWAWQTYAWSGGQWDPRVHIRQVQNGVRIGGADTDLDTGMVADIGQWPNPTHSQPAALHLEGPVWYAYETDSAGKATGRWFVCNGQFSVEVPKAKEGELHALYQDGLIDFAVYKSGPNVGKNSLDFPRAGWTEMHGRLVSFSAPVALTDADRSAVAAALAGLVPTVEELRAAVDAAVKARLDGATVHTAGS